MQIGKNITGLVLKKLRRHNPEIEKHIIAHDIVKIHNDNVEKVKTMHTREYVEITKVDFLSINKTEDEVIRNVDDIIEAFNSDRMKTKISQTLSI
jgi:hypothetical protein